MLIKILFSCLLSNQIYLQKDLLLSEILICDNDFTIDSYVVSVEVLSKSNYLFMSLFQIKFRDYENLLYSLKGELLPNGFLRYDAAFVRNSKNCSNGSLGLVIIESNKHLIQILKNEKVLNL
jgi:hypothetical protein